ncbi:MAG TPA: recombination-associated protein RdgC [Xanthomonadales bacterium]|nr:recombination-associated protein RdgC [Xanthomonadales bacterium]
MFFKNLTLYRFPKSAAEALGDGLEKRLKKHALKPCGPLEMQARGWVSPFGRNEPGLSHQVGHFLLLTLGLEDKILPPAVVNEVLAGKLEALAEERGKPVGGRERKRLKDEVLFDLMPRAFSRPGRLSGYFDLKRGWAVFDTSSAKAAEQFLTVLRESLGSFVAIPLDPEESPRNLMTGWLTGAKLPEGFELGNECELKDPADTGAVVRARKLDLDSPEIREHLKSGKQASMLGLVAEERSSFVLGEDLTLRKLKFLDVVTEELENTERESPRAELDARFALMTLTLEPMLHRLEEVFRLTRPRDR